MKQDIIREMLETIRSSKKEEVNPMLEGLGTGTPIRENNEYREFMDRMNSVITEEDDGDGNVSMRITNNTKEFGDIRASQEDTIKKTVGQNVEFGDDDGLVFYPEKDDLIMNGEIKSIGLSFQFRYAEPSGDGLFIWTDGLQLTEANNRVIGKLRDAFLNWKDGITQDDNLIKKLKQAYERENH